jgi:hypothetical protein
MDLLTERARSVYTRATAAPLGAASRYDGNGACITSLSVKAAAALQSPNFPKPKSIMCLQGFLNFLPFVAENP